MSLAGIEPQTFCYLSRCAISYTILESSGVVDSTSAFQAEGLGFNPHQRQEPHKLIYLVKFNKIIWKKHFFGACKAD